MLMFEWLVHQPLGPCSRGTTSWLGGDTGGQLCAVTALREVGMNMSDRLQGNWMASTFMVSPTCAVETSIFRSENGEIFVVAA